MPCRNLVFLFLVFSVFLSCDFLCGQTSARAGSLSGNYTDPKYFTSLPFGKRSHWIQPWRGFLTTPLASRFTNGLGFNLATGQLQQAKADLIMQQLAKYGFKHVRLEIGWGSISYQNESAVDPSGLLPPAYLAACVKYGVRPMMLLNCNDGRPCPMATRSCTPLSNAGLLATQLELTNVADLKAGYSVLMLNYAATQSIFTSITNNQTVQLSSPLVGILLQGIPVFVAELKYRPFSPSNTSEYNETMTGWRRYVDTIATYTSAALGTLQNNTDRGFDLEVYNELTFGEKYLSINNYYTSAPYAYPYANQGFLSGQNAILRDLVRETASQLTDSSPQLYAGVRLSDGFPNTQPWSASSLEPVRVSALNKHPYRNIDYYNVAGHGDTTQQNTQPLNALGEMDTSGFAPSYRSSFPEYFGTAIQTETLLRDSGPITNYITMQVDGVLTNVTHGSTARSQGPEVPVWVTEWYLDCDESQSGADTPSCVYLQAKNYLRFAAFFLNKGVERVYFFAAGYGDRRGGIVLDSFVSYAAGQNASYPPDDSPLVSRTLNVLGRVMSRMQMLAPVSSSQLRSIGVRNISDTHDHYQFAGDGTAAHPPLYNREVFAFLPYQTGPQSFVVFFYVMTRYTGQVYNASLSGGAQYDMPPEDYTVEITGLNINSASQLAVYDPFFDRQVAVDLLSTNQNSVSVLLHATDYPQMLIITEAPSSSTPGTTKPTATTNPPTTAGAAAIGPISYVIVIAMFYFLLQSF